MKKALTVAAVIATGLSLVVPGVANADEAWINDCAKTSDTATCNIWFSSGSNPAPVVSEMVFHTYGEYVELFDYKADGRGIWAEITWNGTSHTVSNTAGVSDKPVTRQYSIADGTVVYFKVCQTDDGSHLNCYLGNIKA